MTENKLIRINKNKLPVSWDVAKIEEISTVILGQSPASSSYNTKGEGLPFFQGKAEFGPFYPQTVKWCTEPKKTALKNDVLISVRAPVGPTNLSPAECCIGRGLAAIRPDDGISYKYLLYYLRSIESEVASLGTGTTFKAISGGILKNLPVSLAPENEQKSIVAEIEKQFSRLDEAVDNLKRVKANLKRYKASVLKAAVEGKLTEEWRKKHPDVEPADKLLERILAERRKKWEKAELAKMRAKGKEPRDDKWKKKYKEPSSPNIEELPSIPSTWAWATLPQLGELNRGKSKHRPRNDPILYDGLYPFIQTGDIRHATGIINQYTQTYSEKGLKQSRLWPKGTLCITIAANIADTALLGLDACFPDSVVGFIPGADHIDVRFVEYFIRTAKEDLEQFAPATAQKNINLAILREVAVPLPPEKEQQKIIDEIEKCLSVAEGIEVSAEQNMLRAERLSQSILKKAFSGKLIPQNSSDKS